jgi:hypothetical protein
MKNFFLLFALVPSLAYGQESTQRLNQRLKSDIAIERATVVLHQPVYVAGDSVFCSVSYTTSKGIKPRKIVSLELWNSENKIFFQQDLLLKAGLGKGAFFIAADAKPGTYSMVIRTYENEVVYRNDFAIHGTSLVGELKIYPESGYFISDLTNTAVLRYSPEMATGFFRIKSADGTNVVSKTLDSTGYLQFQFEPKSNETYRAEVLKGTANYAVALSAVKEAGVSIQVAKGDVVSCTIFSKGIQANDLQLLVCNQQGVAFSAPVNVAENGFNVSFPNFLTGDFQAVVVDQQWNVLAKRWISFAAPGSASTIQIKKNQFNTREQVDVQVQTPPQAKHTALRVIKKDLFSHGAVGYPTDLTNRNILLATREYDLLPWNKLKLNAPIKAKSDQYLTITGRALHADTNQPVPDSTLIMFFFQNQVIGYETTILKNGNFTLPIMYDFYAREKVFYTTRTKGRDDWNIIVELETDSIKLASLFGSTSITTTSNPYSIYENNKRVIDGSYHYFKPATATTEIRANAKFEDELGGVDTSVKLADYVAFTTISELTREILPAVEHRKIRDRDVVRVYTTHKRPTNVAGPLYIIDGVMTKDPSNFLNLKPEDVISIKVVKDYMKLRNLGAIADNGVILVDTKNPNRAKNFDSSFPLDGLIFDKRVKFFDGTSQTSNRTPDLRPCLLWVPTVDPSGRYSFYTSDDVGEYLIQLISTDESGIQSIQTSTITVAPGGLKP